MKKWVLVVLVLVSSFMLVPYVMFLYYYKSEAYITASEYVRANKESTACAGVIKKVELAIFDTQRLSSTASGNGRGRFNLKFYGDKGQGKLYITLKRENFNKWQVINLRIVSCSKS